MALMTSSEGFYGVSVHTQRGDGHSLGTSDIRSQALRQKTTPLLGLLAFVHLANKAARRCRTFELNRG
jgi:hypothetical protein